MKVDIVERVVETDDINIVLVGAKNFPDSSLLAKGHILICHNNRKKVKCFDDNLSIAKLEGVVDAIGSLFAMHGVNSFVKLRERFLINIDNLYEIRVRSSSSNLYFLEAEFQNGQVFTLYRGSVLKYAKQLLEQYQNAENKYLEQFGSER